MLSEVFKFNEYSEKNLYKWYDTFTHHYKLLQIIIITANLIFNKKTML